MGYWGRRIAPVVLLISFVTAGIAWDAPATVLGSVSGRAAGGPEAQAPGGGSAPHAPSTAPDSTGGPAPSASGAAGPGGPAARPVIQPLSPQSSTQSVPALFARSGGSRGSGADAGPAPDSDQDVVVSLQTGMVGGCARLEQVDPPTLDCSVRVGDSLVDTIKAEARGGSAGTSWVRIEAGLQAQMTLRKLDASGRETDEPLVERDDLSTRFRFTPRADQVTRPSEPIRLEVMALAQDDAGSTTAKAVIHLRLHVLSGKRTVVGYSFEDANGNGARDFDEPGLPSWGIGLHESGGRSLGSTRTDSGGRFTFEVAAAGVYEVAADAREGWTPTRPDAVKLDLSGDPGSGAVIDVLFGNRRVETQPDVSSYVSTDRGCQETGNARPYTVGDKLLVYLGVNGLPEADLSLRRELPSGQSELLFDRRRLPGGQAFSFESTAGTSPGAGRLVLEAFAPSGGPALAKAECGYTVDPAATPSIDYAPGKVDFGPVTVGQSRAQSVVLRNNGQAPLYLSSLGIQGGGGSPFSIATPNAGNTSIPPGGSYTLALQYAPRGSGNYQDYLQIRCNATNQPLVSIPVFGQTYDALPDVTAQIQSDRGCLEDQQNPLYFVGDAIQYQFQINGTSAPSALVKVEDVLPNGQTKIVYNRQVPLNQPVTPGSARIAPPYGDETLRLTAQVGQYQVRDECSFKVASGGTRIGGYKFKDVNGNGLWEGCPLTPGNPGSEPPIPGWGVTITGPESYTTTTDGEGRFEFIVGAPGTYYITEETRDGWAPTRPQTVSYNLQCYPGESPAPVLFGNKPVQGCGCVCPPCGGATPGAITATPWIPPPPGQTPTATSNFPPPVSTPTATSFPPPPGTPPGTPPPPPPPPVCTVQISPRPSLMNVAELAQFTASTTGGGSSRSYQWAVSGEVIRDYLETTRQAWSTTQMQPADFQRQTLGFYWKPLANQRFPNNAGPQPRTVSVTVTTPQGSCTDQVTLSVERNNTNISRQAEDWYTTNHNQAILVEHTLWHAQFPFQGFNYDGTLFFDFHRQYVDRFNNWRAEFGYPPVGMWDSGTSIPRGVDIDHAARAGFYTPLPKPSWFTLFGTIARGNNGLPCDTQSGQRQLRDYPNNRRLLGCAVTQAWHNGVHTGVGGDMLNPQWSPRDPVFWRWHNFVDIISQERMSVFLAAAASDPAAERLAEPQGPDQQRRTSPPHVVYEVPFRLYRFHESLERYAVTFDEPVSGLKASDLTVGGSPATAVTGERAGPYVFTGFTRPEYGEVQVELAGAGIQNLDNERFEGGTWTYVLVDPALDEDRDALTNAEEVNQTFTNPQDRDSDDDGLADGDEVKIHHTRPLMFDSDLDSASDRCELEKGSDPSDPADTAKGCPVKSIFMCWVGNGEAVDR